MVAYIIRRVLAMIPMLFLISIVSFVIMQLPPGDALTSVLDTLRRDGFEITPAIEAQAEALRKLYGLDKPVLIQYFMWLFRLLQGNFGYSFKWGKPVSEIIWRRLALTLVVTGSALIFTWLLAFPIGFYSAVKQYSIGDYIFTFVGFIGLAIPNFMLALILMYLAFVWFGDSLGGLFSSEFIDAPWSLAKVIDLLKHLWIPMIVVGTAGTAGLIRIMRNNLLDELQKPYVTTARAKGLTEFQLLIKYPVRVAINPFLSTVGWLLPTLISGASITAVVLSLPTAGSLLLSALRFQDTFLSGAIIMMMAVLTVMGTLVSDLLLVAVDPRIRFIGMKKEMR